MATLNCSSGEPNIIKAKFIISSYRIYTLDFDPNIQMQELKLMIEKAAHLSKNNFKLFSEGEEYTHYNEEKFNSIFPDQDLAVFTLQVGPGEEMLDEAKDKKDENDISQGKNLNIPLIKNQNQEENPNIIKAKFIISSSSRIYTLDFDQNIQMQELKLMIQKAAHLSKNNFKLFSEGKEYTQYNEEKLDSIFPDQNLVEFLLEIGPNANTDKIEDKVEESQNNPIECKTLESIKSISFAINRTRRWILFFLFAIINLLMNFDHGTIPAATEQIRSFLNLSDSQLGLFGSFVFAGVIIGSLISMTVINICNRKYILMICLILCGISLFIFTITKAYVLLCIDRVIIGVFQAFISIYLPLWCEQFGVETKKTTMMALIQVAPPLGVLIGYIITTLLNMYLTYLPYFGDIEKDKRWLFSFYIQSFIIWGISISLLFFSDKYFNSKARRVPLEVEESLNDIERKTTGNPDLKKISFFYEGNQNYAEEKTNLDEIKEKNSSPNIYEKAEDDEYKDEDEDEENDKNIKKEEMKEIKEEIIVKKENDKNNENIDNSDNIKDNKDENKISNNENIEKNLNENSSNDKNKKEEISFLQKLKIIFSEPLFICSCLILAVLYFIVTCVQYWSSDYMLIALEIEDEKKRLYSFTTICLTSPTLGLILGGYIVDKIGGYSKKGSLIFTVIVSFLSILPAIPLPLVDSLYVYAILLWLLLFCGASMIPTYQGIAIASLPKNIQGSGNSFVIFFNNLLGYLPAPFVYGFLKDLFSDENDPKKGSRYAHRMTIWITSLVTVFVCTATIVRFKKGKEYDEKMGRDTSQNYDKNKININENTENYNDSDLDAIRPRESSLKPENNENKNEIEINDKENDNQNENKNDND